MAELMLKTKAGEIPISQVSEHDLNWYATECKRNDLRAAAIDEQRRRSSGAKEPPAQASLAPAGSALPPRTEIPPELLMPVRDPAEFTRRISELSKVANLLTSSTTLPEVPHGADIAFSRLEVNPDPKFGHVYPQRGGGDEDESAPRGASGAITADTKVSLTSATLARLFAMAGCKLARGYPKEKLKAGDPGYCQPRLNPITGEVLMDPETGEILREKPDSPRDQNFSRYVCRGARLGLDGSWSPGEAEKCVDLRDGSNVAKARASQPKRIAKDRENLNEATATKSKARLTRDLLGIPGTYSASQLTKDFVVVHLVVHGRTEVPELKQPFAMAVLQNAVQGHLQLFGRPMMAPSSSGPALPAAPVQNHPQLPARDPEEFDSDGVSVQDPVGKSIDVDVPDDDSDEDDDLPDFGDNDKV
jgi:hypothetical protein